jgi:hypothetical protein
MSSNTTPKPRSRPRLARTHASRSLMPLGDPSRGGVYRYSSSDGIQFDYVYKKKKLHSPVTPSASRLPRHSAHAPSPAHGEHSSTYPPLVSMLSSHDSAHADPSPALGEQSSTLTSPPVVSRLSRHLGCPHPSASRPSRHSAHHDHPHHAPHNGEHDKSHGSHRSHKSTPKKTKSLDDFFKEAEHATRKPTRDLYKASCGANAA